MSPLWPISLCKVIGDGRRLFRPLFYTINIPGRQRKRSAAIPCQTNIQTIQKGKPDGLAFVICFSSCFICSEPFKYMAALSVLRRSNTRN